MSHAKSSFPVRGASVIVLILLVLAGARWWWLEPTEWERNLRRDPASVEGVLPPSLKTIRMELESVEDEALDLAVVAAARLAIPPLLGQLDLEPEVKQRLKDRLYSSSFRDRVVPFLMNSVYLYEPSGSRVPRTFRDVFLPKLSALSGTPGLNHALFSTETKKVEAEKTKGPTSGLQAKKALVATVLRMYDALYLQTNAHVGDGVPKLNASQLKVVGDNFRKILESLVDSMKDNPEIADGIRNILADDEKAETITLAVSRFVYEFIERHYQVYITPIRREQALRKWANDRLERFLDRRDPELYQFLEWEQKRKKYAVQYTVDGLQGNLMEALTGNNPTFLRKIATEHRNRASFWPIGENAVAMPDTQNTYLEWIAADPRRLQEPLYLPFFKKLYRENRSAIVRDGISTTPTISVRNLPIAMTGIDVVGPKRGTGVPNFHYIDRKGVDREDHRARAYYFYGNDAILLPDITRRAGMRTVFERVDALGLDSISCHNPYDRGATIAFDGFLNLAIGEKVRDFGDIACLSELGDRSRAEVDLQKTRARLLRLMHDYLKDLGPGAWNQVKNAMVASNIKDAMKQYVMLSQKGLPAYLQIYSPWPDHFAHFQGPFSDAIISPTGELNRLDHWLGMVNRFYEQANLSSRTQFGMAGDHGLTPVYAALNPEEEVFHKFAKETGTPLEILKISSDEGEGPKVNHPEKPAPVKGYDLIIASTAGGNFMIDAFVDQGSRWAEQPTLAELRHLRTIGGKTIDLVGLIVARLPNSLDYLAVRDSTCGPEKCALSLLAMRGKDTVRERVYRVGDRLYYKPTSHDLLEVGALTSYRPVDSHEQFVHGELYAKCVGRAELTKPDGWCTAEEWRRLTESTPRPDSVVQIAHLYDSDKAGTINLFPREGVGYNTKVPGRHAGEHFHEKDAFIGFWGAGTNRSERVGSAVNGQVAPTLMEWIAPNSSAVPGEFGFLPVGDGP